MAKYNEVVAKGLIPNIPPAILTSSGNIAYPTGEQFSERINESGIGADAREQVWTLQQQELGRLNALAHITWDPSPESWADHIILVLGQ